MKKEKIIDLLGDPSRLRHMRERVHAKEFPEMFELERKLIEAVRGSPFPDGARMVANEFRARVIDGEERVAPSGYRFASGAEGNLYALYPDIAVEYAGFMAREIAKKLGKKVENVIPLMHDEGVEPLLLATTHDWMVPHVKYALDTTNDYRYPPYHFDFFEVEEIEQDADPRGGVLKASAMEKRRAWKPLPEEVVHAIADHFIRTAERSALRGGPTIETLGFSGKPFIYDIEK